MQTSSDVLLRKRIRTAMKTTVRTAFKTIRLINKYNKYKGFKNILQPSFFLAVETGSFTNISGTGNLYTNFWENQQLSGYSGENCIPSTPKDGNFACAKLRYLPFDHTFTFLPIDVDKCKFLVTLPFMHSENFK